LDVKKERYAEVIRAYYNDGWNMQTQLRTSSLYGAYKESERTVHSYDMDLGLFTLVL